MTEEKELQPVDIEREAEKICRKIEPDMVILR